MRDLGDLYGFEGLRSLGYVVIRSSCEKAGSALQGLQLVLALKSMACRWW